MNKLGALGDFAANYVLNNSNVLNTYWKDVSKLILAEASRSTRMD
jgi:hypothetical protein